MKPIKVIFAKYSAFLLGMLAHLGIWGPAIIALMDSAAIGVPMDPVIVGYAYQQREHIWLVAFYCVSAALGSTLGCLVPYWIGRAGEELFLLKKSDHHRIEQLRDRFEKQEFFFLMIPAMLPPPTPFKLFVMAAGAFEMRIPLMLLSIFMGRLIRFSLTSFLAIKFGPEIVHFAGAVAKKHLPLVFGALAAGALLYFLIRLIRNRKKTERVLP